MAEVNNEPEPSSGTGPGAEQAPETPSVTGVAAPESDDRPLKNVMAEWSRKFEQQSRLIADLASLVTAQQQPMRPVPYQPPAAVAPTDEDLYTAAQQGNAQAILELNRRVSERAAAQQVGQYSRQQAVSQAINMLAARHPAFNDPTSDLYNAAMRERHILVSSGAHPQSPETALEAMKLAIVNNPGLAAGTQAVTDNRSRTSSVSSHNVPESTATSRPRGDGRQQPAPKLDPRTAALAQRMGVKDPAGAMKRLNERSAAGKSSVSPMIATIMREEG